MYPFLILEKGRKKITITFAQTAPSALYNNHKKPPTLHTTHTHTHSHTHTHRSKQNANSLTALLSFWFWRGVRWCFTIHPLRFHFPIQPKAKAKQMQSATQRQRRSCHPFLSFAVRPCMCPGGGVCVWWPLSGCRGCWHNARNMDPSQAALSRLLHHSSNALLLFSATGQRGQQTDELLLLPASTPLHHPFSSSSNPATINTGKLTVKKNCSLTYPSVIVAKKIKKQRPNKLWAETAKGKDSRPKKNVSTPNVKKKTLTFALARISVVGR